MLPSEVLGLPNRERSFMLAAYQFRKEEDAKAIERAREKARR